MNAWIQGISLIIYKNPTFAPWRSLREKKNTPEEHQLLLSNLAPYLQLIVNSPCLRDLRLKTLSRLSFQASLCVLMLLCVRFFTFISRRAFGFYKKL
jgi:hypothetical protein